MTGNLGTLVVRLALELKRYKAELRDAVSDTQNQMAQAQRSTSVLTAETKKLDQQAGSTATQLGRMGRALADGNLPGAAKQMAGVAASFSTAGAAVGSLGMAVGVAAAALAGYVVISYKASEEAERQANILRLTGNAAGLLAGDINAMARSVARDTDGTVGNARDIAEALAGTGKIGRTAMQSVAGAVELFAQASGQSRDSVTADFAKMADGVAKWAAKHNEQYHFLNVAQYDYIKALEDSGRAQEAMIVVGEAWKVHLADVGDNLGILQRAWKSMGEAASWAWDKALSIGRKESTTDALDAVTARVNDLRDRYAGKAFLPDVLGIINPAGLKKHLDEALQEQALLQETIRLEQRSAAAKAGSAAATQRQIEAGQAWDALTKSNRNSQQRLADALADVKKQGEAAGKSQAEIAKMQDAVRERMERGTGATKKLTAAQRDLNQHQALMARLSGLSGSFFKDWDALNAAHAKGRLSLDDLTQAQARLLAQQPFAVALAKEEAEAEKELAKAREADAKAYADTVDARQAATASVQDQIVKEREAIAVIGLARTEVVALEAAKLDETAATKLRLAAIADEIDWSGKLGEAYRQEAAQLKELAALKRQGAVKQASVDAAEKAAKAWEKTADSIESMLTDALMRGFESGKGFGESLGDSIVNMFKTYVAREIATAITRAIMSAMASTQWGQALATMFTGSGGGGGGTNLLSLAASAYQAYAGATAGAGSVSLMYANAVGALGGDSMGALITANGQWAGVAAESAAEAAAYSAAATESAAAAAAASEATVSAAAVEGGGAASGASGAAAWAGWAALIVAAVVAAENLYSAGYNRQALSSAATAPNKFGENSYTSGQAYGNSDVYNSSLERLNRSIMDSMGMSEKWADILSGTTRMATLFGRKLKAYGFDVDMAGATVDVSGYEYHKGGLFRSNKTISREVDPGDAQMVREMALGTRDAAIEAAKAMGLSTHAIESYTGELKINMKGVNDAAEAQKRYNEAFGRMYDDMIKHAQKVTFGEKLSAQVEQLRDSARNMAAAMGKGTDGIDSFSGSLNVTMEQMDGSKEAAELLAKASEDLYWQMLQAADGFSMSKEKFTEFMQSVRADIEAAGITGEGIGSTLAQGAIGRMTESQVGEALSESIIGGIYNTIASNAMAPVAEAFMGQIITPIFTAIMSGVPISQAVSQAAIDSVVASAQRASAVLNAVFSDPGVQAAIAGIQSAIGSIARVSVSSAKYVRSYGSAVSAAGQKAQAAAQERYGLETQLLNLLGNTAKLRERELASLAAGNRALQLRIWALQDARAAMDDAYAALERAADKQRETWQGELDAAIELEGRVKDVFDVLKDGIRDLRGEVDSTLMMQADAGRYLIRAALDTGVLPDSDDLADAIDSVSRSIEQANYGSATDRARAMLVFANELEALQGVAEPQLSAAEQQVVLLESQLEALDQQLQAAKDQMDALLGIDTSVRSVEAAVASLGQAMAAYASAVAAGLAVPVSTGAAPGTVSTSGSLSTSTSGSGGGSTWTADGYWAKNPDLQKEFYSANLANSPDFNKDPNLSARDEYLTWHWKTYGQKDNRQFARGAAFTNGIVSRPTLFDVGQMGEKTSEGILPLANVGGRLGVHSVSGGDEQTKALLRELIREVRASRSEGRATALHTSRVRDVLERVTQKGNSLAVKTLASQSLATKAVTP